MSATASEEFLKAHAVISRSWVMAQIAASRRTRKVEMPEGVNNVPTLISYLDSIWANKEKVDQGSEIEYVKWYDHDDHRHFDVCADDHCQRYQGLTRATGTTVRKVIDSTWGQVLKYDGELCDARFSKCCGGGMEKFSTCWSDEDMPYLQPLADAPGHIAINPDCEEAKCFCDTQDKEILGQVLNNYDQETVDFYRWKVEYGRQELSELIARRSGYNLGIIQKLEPLERGESERIYKLRIVGSEKTLTVGKELEIRRLLSESHLKSSAFEVEYLASGETVTWDCQWDTLVLHGKGWGHGVGLCQIGAAVMASQGYTYTEILTHYYPGTVID